MPTPGKKPPPPGYAHKAAPFLDTVLWLARVLDAHDDKAEREKALSALRQEIPDFDARVEKERARASVKVEAAKPRGANQHGEKDEGRENFPSSKERKTGANSPERIIARLKRDAVTDTHAAAPSHIPT